VITYRGAVNRRTMTSWIAAAVISVAALVDLIVRPVHWERTLALAVVLAIAALAFGYWNSRVASGSGSVRRR
jgi:hypothetical protein